MLKNKFFVSIAFLSALSLFSINTDREAFFGVGTDPATITLASDSVYPQGRLFPFSFYSVGGGAVTKRGELLSPEERAADQKAIFQAGVTMLGPQYELNDEILEVARQHGVKAIYSIGVHIDGERINLKSLDAMAKEKRPLDLEKIAASLKEQMDKLVEHKEIGYWYLSVEELRFWRPYEINFLQAATAAIRANDPYKRPVFMYEPGHRPASGLAKTLIHQDISAKGMYTNYAGRKKERVWVRHSMLQATESIKLVPGDHIFPLAVPEMFQQPEPEELQLVSKWVRHDSYCALANGAKGMLVFSASKRPNFTAWQSYLDAYLQVCRELTGSLQLGQVILFGKVMDDLTLDVLEGPKELHLTAKSDKDSIKYPSVSFLNLAYDRCRYLLVVNSANEPVKAVIDNLVYGSNVKVHNLFSDAKAFTVPEGNFEVNLDALEACVFKVFQAD